MTSIANRGRGLQLSAALLAMAAACASGCSVQESGTDQDEAATTESDALTTTNAWKACSFGQTLDTFGGQPIKCDHPGDSGP